MECQSYTMVILLARVHNASPINAIDRRIALSTLSSSLAVLLSCRACLETEECRAEVCTECLPTTSGQRLLAGWLYKYLSCSVTTIIPWNHYIMDIYISNCNSLILIHVYITLWMVWYGIVVWSPSLWLQVCESARARIEGAISHHQGHRGQNTADAQGSRPDMAPRASPTHEGGSPLLHSAGVMRFESKCFFPFSFAVVLLPETQNFSHITACKLCQHEGKSVRPHGCRSKTDTACIPRMVWVSSSGVWTLNMGCSAFWLGLLVELLTVLLPAMLIQTLLLLVFWHFYMPTFFHFLPFRTTNGTFVCQHSSTCCRPEVLRVQCHASHIAQAGTKQFHMVWHQRRSFFVLRRRGAINVWLLEPCCSSLHELKFDHRQSGIPDLGCTIVTFRL